MRQLNTKILATCTILFCVTTLLGQSDFSVEGQTVRTETFNKTYNFGYLSSDISQLVLKDSTIEYSNPEKTIVKKTTFSGSNGQPQTSIEYFRINGEDSISKHFIGDDLITIYETQYDDLDRIVVYRMTDLQDSTNGFVWFYDYKDSIISSGKIVIQTIYASDEKGEKKFHLRVTNDFDSENKIIKETKESKVDDPDPSITIFNHDNNKQLSEEEFGETENKRYQQIDLCDKEIITDLKVTNFTEMKNLIKKLLVENKQMLNSIECVNYSCKYVSLNRQSSLTIVKRIPYWCEGRTATFTIIQTY